MSNNAVLTSLPGFELFEAGRITIGDNASLCQDYAYDLADSLRGWPFFLFDVSNNLGICP